VLVLTFYCLSEMNAKFKKTAITLAIAAMLIVLPVPNLPLAFSSNNGARIDLFTQKELFIGKMTNVTFDAFAPGEEVQVSAYVTYNDYQVPGVLVAFGVQGPSNPIRNITFFRTAFTNDTGIATINFRIPQTVAEVFGNWTVAGNVQVDSAVVQDFLTFRVGWIVEVTSIRTMDQNYVYQEEFTRKKQIIVELGLKSIATTNKSTDLTVSIKDSLGHPLNSSELSDFIVPSNEVLVHAYIHLFIPENASIGTATAYACAYTIPVLLGGVAYCPEVSTRFLIINPDVAIITVKPSSASVNRGEIEYINVTVANEGTEVESFLVSAFANETEIGTILVTSLRPSMNTVTSFSWNTSSVSLGAYQISAFAAYVPGEISLSNNMFIDGYVQVMPSTSLTIHDIALLDVTSSVSLGHIGDVLPIDVILENVGTVSESFNVILYYGQNVAGTKSVKNLPIGNRTTLVFYWWTTGVSQGNYTLAAYAVPVVGETNVANNYFVDGIVKLVQNPRSKSIPLWFCWFLLLLLLALVATLLILWFYYRRRKKSEESFYSGWTAWYYGYDMRPGMGRAKV
jgi:hypothetical protein